MSSKHNCRLAFGQYRTPCGNEIKNQENNILKNSHIPVIIRILNISAFTDGDPKDDFSEDDCRSSSNDSLISTEYFQKVLEELELKAVEDSTMEVYMVAWRAMNEFYCRLDNKPKPWEQRMSLFIAFMIKKRYEKATIQTYISGIKYVLRNILHVDVDDNAFRFTALIKAARYKNNKVALRMPIKLGLLNRMLEEVANVPRFQNQPYLVALYRAMLWQPIMVCLE